MRSSRPLLKKLELRGMDAAYLDQGDGPPVLFVHCSSGTHRQWSFAFDDVSRGHRVLAPDLFGYGESSPWPKDPPRPDVHDIDVLERLAADAGEPVHVVGHSYGGALAMELARRSAEAGTGLVRSLFLVEPVSFHLLRTGGMLRQWDRVAKVAQRCIDLAEGGHPQRAAARYMGFWLGRAKWWLMPRRMKRGIVSTIHKVGDEWSNIFHLDHSPDAYAAITCPTHLVWGSRTPRPAAAVVGLLGDTLPNARVSAIPGAGHMSPFTHREVLRSQILEHLELSRDGSVSRSNRLRHQRA